MTNKKIREVAKENGVKMWQIADKLGVCDSQFSRKMRYELGESEKASIFKIIVEISRKGAKTA